MAAVEWEQGSLVAVVAGVGGAATMTTRWQQEGAVGRCRALA